MSHQNTLRESKFLLGNEAIAQGAIDTGIRFASSYPGTPASEILPAFFKIAKEEGIPVEGRWMINEKVALEAALAASWSNIPSMVSMKQVGLNVAMDPLMSSAYTGVEAPFIIVSVDDPGPHSSQTEQDSRFMAMAAKIPVVDPSSPEDAYRLMFKAYQISEEFNIPVILRPVLRVSHSRESVDIKTEKIKRKVEFKFQKNPERWAATPKFRFLLHKKLNEKLRKISKKNTECIKEKIPNTKSKKIFIASGAMFGYAMDLGLDPVVKIDVPYPIDGKLFSFLEEKFDEIWVLEETYPVIEIQFTNRKKVKGRLSGDIPSEGEIDLEILESILKKRKSFSVTFEEKPPRLCPGCGHRPAFYAIKKSFPQGIYPGDIGCYTLGVNLKAVDTCLCMGASVSKGVGFAKAAEYTEKEIPVIATIGDSTFLHSGIPPLIEAVNQNASLILVILDNHTTAMTGGQPVHNVDFFELVKGCGVKKIEKVHSYNFKDICDKLKNCWEFSKTYKTPSVLICESPCVIYGNRVVKTLPEVDKEICTNCGICYKQFECPAIVEEKRKAKIVKEICTGCGVCIEICPKNAIKS